jgi:hypothetical protein
MKIFSYWGGGVLHPRRPLTRATAALTLTLTEGRCCVSSKLVCARLGQHDDVL